MFTVIVLVLLVKPVENVSAFSFPLKVFQSVNDNTPLLLAEAVGTFNVITGVVVGLATELLKSVPVVPNVKAATDVTVPPEAVFAMVILPPALVTEIPVPAVSVDFVNVFPVLFPISNCPSV